MRGRGGGGLCTHPPVFNHDLHDSPLTPRQRDLDHESMPVV